MVRVERGEATIIPSAYERPLEHPSVRDAVHIDDETAVLVMSKVDGQQRLVTEKGGSASDLLLT